MSDSDDREWPENTPRHDDDRAELVQDKVKQPSDPAGRLELEPSDLSNGQAFGLIGLRFEVEAESGAHAAYIAPEKSEHINQLQEYYNANGCDRWRLPGDDRGHGSLSPADYDEYDREGLYTVDVIERRVFEIDGGEPKPTGADPTRYAIEIELKRPTRR